MAPPPGEEVEMGKDTTRVKQLEADVQKLRESMSSAPAAELLSTAGTAPFPAHSDRWRRNSEMDDDELGKA